MNPTDRDLKRSIVSLLPIPQGWDSTAGGGQGDWVAVESAGGRIKVDASITGSTLPDAQAIPTRGAGTVALAANAVTVTAAQVELKAGAAAMAGRKQLIVYPPAAGTIYWGPTGVTSATGAPLAAGSAPVAFDMDPANPLAIFAVNDGTNRDVRVVESK